MMSGYQLLLVITFKEVFAMAMLLIISQNLVIVGVGQLGNERGNTLTGIYRFGPSGQSQTIGRIKLKIRLSEGTGQEFLVV